MFFFRKSAWPLSIVSALLAGSVCACRGDSSGAESKDDKKGSLVPFEKNLSDTIIKRDPRFAALYASLPLQDYTNDVDPTLVVTRDGAGQELERVVIKRDASYRTVAEERLVAGGQKTSCVYKRDNNILTEIACSSPASKATPAFTGKALLAGESAWKLNTGHWMSEDVSWARNEQGMYSMRAASCTEKGRQCVIREYEGNDPNGLQNSAKVRRNVYLDNAYSFLVTSADDKGRTLFEWKFTGNKLEGFVENEYYDERFAVVSRNCLFKEAGRFECTDKTFLNGSDTPADEGKSVYQYMRRLKDGQSAAARELVEYKSREKSGSSGYDPQWRKSYDMEFSGMRCEKYVTYEYEGDTRRLLKKNTYGCNGLGDPTDLASVTEYTYN